MPRTALAIALAVVLVGCGASTVDSSATPPDSTATASAGLTPAPTASRSPEASEGSGTAIDIGGRSLWFECRGTGSPTVLLESGLGGDLRTWERVQPALGESARTCAYDRAGIGQSDPAAQPRTTQDAVEDLHAALSAAQIEPPYVMVGFSIGGLITQHYAASYPDEMAGIVLVESNHPLEAEQFEANLTQAQIEQDRASVLDNPEGLDPYTSYEQVQEAGPLPEVPLIVVTAGVPEGWPPGWDAELFDALRAEQQAELATLVTGGRQVFAETSGHHVPSTQPEVVIEAVESVLAEAR